VKKFKKIPSKDNTVSQVQNNVEEALNPIIDSPIINGVLVKDVCLTALQPTLVKHKLGRDSLGYIIVRKRSDSRIWDVQDFHINKKTTIALTCSHDVKVDLWIF